MCENQVNLQSAEQQRLDCTANRGGRTGQLDRDPLDEYRTDPGERAIAAVRELAASKLQVRDIYSQIADKMTAMELKFGTLSAFYGFTEQRQSEALKSMANAVSRMNNDGRLETLAKDLVDSDTGWSIHRTDGKVTSLDWNDSYRAQSAYDALKSPGDLGMFAFAKSGEFVKHLVAGPDIRISIADKGVTAEVNDLLRVLPGSSHVTVVADRL